MDSLIAMGAAAATVYGIFAIYRIGWGFRIGDMELVHQYSHDIYFESAGTILTLITVGKYLETKSKGKTSEAITKLMNLAPKTVTVVRDGKEQVIDAADVVQGDIFVIKPGESVAVRVQRVSAKIRRSHRSSVLWRKHLRVRLQSHVWPIKLRESLSRQLLESRS